MSDPSNITGWLDLAEKHGPWAFFAVVGGFLCYKLIGRILTHLLKQIDLERESREKSDVKHLESIGKQTAVIDKLSTSNTEANQFQRNEHKTMIIAMKEITDQQQALKEKVIESINKN